MLFRTLPEADFGNKLSTVPTIRVMVLPYPVDPSGLAIGVPSAFKLPDGTCAIGPLQLARLVEKDNLVSTVCPHLVQRIRRPCLIPSKLMMTVTFLSLAAVMTAPLQTFGAP